MQQHYQVCVTYGNRKSHLLALANYLPPFYYNYIAKLSLQWIASYISSSKTKN